MLTLSVKGCGRWCAEDNWLWIRMREKRENGYTKKGRFLLNECLLRDSDTGNNWKRFRLNLMQNRIEGKLPVIEFEVWTGQSGSKDLLQFARGWTIDVAKWMQLGVRKRWYEIKKTEREGNVEIERCGYLEDPAELQRSKAYVCINVKDLAENNVCEPDQTVSKHEKAFAHEFDFRFVLPHTSIESSNIRSVQVDQIVHQRRTDILHDLLPWTLYGKTSARRCNCCSTNRSKEPDGGGIVKALTLLQLSCQYGSYCVNELESNLNILKRQDAKIKNKINRQKYRQNLLKEQTINLKREADVVDCYLDSLQSLLKNMDPETLDRLQTLSKQNHDEREKPSTI